MSELICVPPDDAERMWPLVRELIASAYQKTDDIMPDLLPWLKDGRGTLWLAIQDNKILSALTTSVVDRLSGRVFRLWAVGGTDMAIWKGHITEIEDYARSIGCVKVCFDGREGWRRMLPEYKPATVAFEKVL